MENDVFVLLLGACEGAYALAASFAGEYGIPVALMDESIPDAYFASRFFFECREVAGIGYTGLFRRALSDFYEAHAGKSLILLPMTERYAKKILSECDFLETMYLLPQKNVPVLQSPTTSPEALLLVYTGPTGERHALFARTAAMSDAKEVLAVITEETPQNLLDALPEHAAGIALYAVDEKGSIAPTGEDGALSPFCAFPSAADLSLAEWILADYVFCEKVKEPQSIPEAIFSPYPIRMVKKHILPAEKTRVKLLLRRRLKLTLAPPRGETHHLHPRSVLRRFYRENSAKKIKAKK